MNERKRRYWPRYQLITENGYGSSSVNLAPVAREAESLRRAGWHVMVVKVSNAADRDAKGAKFWATFNKEAK